MRPIKMVDLHRQYLSQRPAIDAAIAEVLAATDFIQGAAVRRFESALATYLGLASAEQVVTCASGTDALQIAYMALGIGPGDEVVTTPFTFVATVEALVLLGAKPVFVDIDPCTYNLDARAVAARVGPRTRAIVPVHLYGQPAELDPLVAIARAHGLALIEDAAQAIGARTRDGAFVGTVGDLGCFSFFPSKNLGAFGDGGAIVARDPALASRCRMLSTHGARQRYHHELLGVNSRLDTLQAAVLEVKLAALDAWTTARQRVARVYDERFAGLDVVTPFVAEGVRHVFNQYSIRTPARGALAAHLARHGIATAVHYPLPQHRQPAFAHLVPTGETFPVAEAVAREILSLPMDPGLTDEEIDRITSAVRGFFGAT